MTKSPDLMSLAVFAQLPMRSILKGRGIVSRDHAGAPPVGEVIAASTIAVGCTVEISGLKSKPELNGTSGLVQGADTEKERWHVAVGCALMMNKSGAVNVVPTLGSDDSSADVISLKADNLTVITNPVPTSAAEPKAGDVCTICHEQYSMLKSWTTQLAEQPAMCLACGQTYCGACNASGLAFAEANCPTCGAPTVTSAEEKFERCWKLVHDMPRGRHTPLALLTLGMFYYDGKGVQKDAFKANTFLTPAAEHGQVAAQCQLGSMFAGGEGVKQTTQEQCWLSKQNAFKWCRLAADNGAVDVSFNLAMIHSSYSEWVDLNTAYDYLQLAAEGGKYSGLAFDLMNVLQRRAQGLKVADYILPDDRLKRNRKPMLFSIAPGLGGFLREYDIPTPPVGSAVTTTLLTSVAGSQYNHWTGTVVLPAKGMPVKRGRVVVHLHGIRNAMSFKLMNIAIISADDTPASIAEGVEKGDRGRDGAEFEHPCSLCLDNEDDAVVDLKDPAICSACGQFICGACNTVNTAEQLQKCAICRAPTDAYISDEETFKRMWNLVHERSHGRYTPWAQDTLGIHYEQGLVVKQDYVEACRWYRLAADQGHHHAENHLGNMYSHGRGVLEDADKAVYWTRRAARSGDAESQCGLGVTLYNRRGCRCLQQTGLQAHLGKQDWTEALLWLQFSAEQGYTRAYDTLDRLHKAKHNTIPPPPPGTAVTIVCLREAASINATTGVVTTTKSSVRSTAFVLLDGEVKPRMFKVINLAV